MATRKSERLAAKQHSTMEGEGLHGIRDGGDDCGLGGRTSIGGAMGLMLAKPKGRNLVIAKAASAAEAAAARLDQLNARTRGLPNPGPTRPGAGNRSASDEEFIAQENTLDVDPDYEPTMDTLARNPQGCGQRSKSRDRSTRGS